MSVHEIQKPALYFACCHGKFAWHILPNRITDTTLMAHLRGLQVKTTGTDGYDIQS